MKDFFKSFFATLLALMVAGGLAFMLLFGRIVRQTDRAQQGGAGL